MSENTTPHTNESSLISSSIVMFSGTLVSRILGFVRSPIMLTLALGLNSPISNSFTIANMLPTLLFGIIAGGLINAVLVPAIVRASNENSDQGDAFINKLLTLSITLLASITFILTLASPIIVKAFAATLSNDWYQITVLFTYWCIPQIFFYGLYAVIGQVLNARENFGPYMWAPALNNVVAIIGLSIIVWLFGTTNSNSIQDVSQWYGQRGYLLVGFSTGGIAAQALVLFIPLKKVGIKFRPDFHWRNSGLGLAGKASLWILATTTLSLIPVAVKANVISGATQRALDAGIDLSKVAANSAAAIAFSLYHLPNALIAVSITTALFPRLAKLAQSKNYKQMQKKVTQSANTIATFNFLALMLIIILSIPISRIFIIEGNRDEILSLVFTLIPLSIGLIGMGLTLAFDKIYYSLDRARNIFFLSIPGQIITIIGYLVCSLLPPQYTTPISNIVSTLGTFITAFLLIFYAQKMLNEVNDKSLLHTHLKLAGITTLMSLIGFMLVWKIGIDFITVSVFTAGLSIAILTPIITIIYLLLLKILKMPELNIVLKAISMIFRKLGLSKIANKFYTQPIN